MRRRVPLSLLNPRDNRAPVPSGAGMGAAAVEESPSPVSRIVPLCPGSRIMVEIEEPASREEEEATAMIWTPAADPKSNAPKKRGRPKGSKNKRKP